MCYDGYALTSEFLPQFFFFFSVNNDIHNDTTPMHFNAVFHGCMRGISETKVCNISLLMVQTYIIGAC